MIHSSPAEARLLEEIQQDLPLCSRPFVEIGTRCGMPEKRVLAALETYIRDDVVREISVILDARKLGFYSSLVAMSTPPEIEEAVAARINSHPRVSHNYHRNHTYNLWFTLAAADEETLLAETIEMTSVFPEIRFDIMPAIKTYKLRVHLRVAESGSRLAGAKRASPTAPRVHGTDETVEFDDEELSLLACLESPFPLKERPWLEIGKLAGTSEARVLQLTDNLRKRSVIRRVAGVLRHQKVGYTANGMSCFSVDGDKIDASGILAATRQQVSHCYWRRTPEGWYYPLFAMIHARTEDECRNLADSIASEIGCHDHLLLFSTIEYKKERAKYFGGNR